jgi:hypothetical protein
VLSVLKWQVHDQKCVEEEDERTEHVTWQRDKIQVYTNVSPK